MEKSVFIIDGLRWLVSGLFDPEKAEPLCPKDNMALIYDQRSYELGVRGGALL